MISFLNKKIKIFLLIAFIFLAFFALSFIGGEKVDAQTADCEIIESETGIRNPLSGNPSGSFNITTPISEDNRPAIYVDIKTNGNCNRLLLQFVNTPEYNQSLSIPLSHYFFFIDLNQGVPSWVTNSFFSTNNPEFTFSFLLGETGNWGNLNCNPPGLNSLDDANYNCRVHLKIAASYYSGSNLVSSDEYEDLTNFFTYKCNIYCSTSNVWQASMSNVPGCPAIGPYGSSNCTSGSSVTVTIPSGGSGVAGSTGSGDFSEAALAPLPGFSATPDVGNFLESLFTFMIVIAGILALIMIVVGGVTYVTTDAFSKKSDGKMYIINALTGLVLALGAWVILNTINPNLASNLGISLPGVSLDGDADAFPSSPQSFGNGTITASTPMPSIGLICPGGGGSPEVQSIINSFVGKTTYRWGGKGGPLPSGSAFPSSPNENNGTNPHMCTDDSGQNVPCRSFCPADSVCLDCSGFVNQVRRCAGLQTFGGTASMVDHSSAIPIDLRSALSGDNLSVNIGGSPYALVPGDLLVWNGHVVIYYGDGKIAEAEGSRQGMQKNNNIKISSITKYRNKVTHLIKVNP